MEGYIGQIMMFAGNFAPKNWAFCQGQLLQISQNTALFSILGTTYGGNGTTTFGLPNLSGRVPVGTGQGAGLSSVQLGQAWGTESVTLTTNQIPAHTHALVGVTEDGNSNSPTNNFPANTKGTDTDYRASGTATQMAAGAIGIAGGSQPHTNMQPSLGMNYVICMYGIYPSRS